MNSMIFNHSDSKVQEVLCEKAVFGPQRVLHEFKSPPKNIHYKIEIGFRATVVADRVVTLFRNTPCCQACHLRS